MSFMKNLTSDASIATEKDSVGGFGPLDSGLYKAKVALAYVITATSGALGLVLNLKTDDDREVRQTLWMTSGDAKGNKNYYEKDGEKNYLPGFIHANALSLLTVGKEISELEPEEKVTKVYSKEAKAEVPTKVQMLVDLLDQEIIVGLIRQTVDKTKLNETTKQYEPTGETRDENEIDKLFRARDRMTTTEIRAKAEEATFHESWSKKWTGVTKNKRSKGAAGAGRPAASAGAAAPAATAKRPSLFA